MYGEVDSFTGCSLQKRELKSVSNHSTKAWHSWGPEHDCMTYHDSDLQVYHAIMPLYMTRASSRVTGTAYGE